MEQVDWRLGNFNILFEIHFCIFNPQSEIRNQEKEYKRWQTKLLSSANPLDPTPTKPGRLMVTVPPMWTLSGNRTN